MRKPSLIDRLWQVALFFGYRVFKCYWFLFRPVTLGSSVVVWCDDKVLLVRNSYKRQYSFPGGGRSSTEESVKAGVRELFEETEIKVDASDVTYAMSAPSRSEWKRDTCDFFETVFESQPEFQIDLREIVFGEFVPFEDLVNYPMTCNAGQYVEWKRKQLAES